MTVEDRRRQLIDGLAAARSHVLEAARAVPPERVAEIFLGTWSLKDLLAHLEGWDYTNLEAIQEILAGRPPSFFQHYDKDWGSYNRGLVETYQRDSFAQLLAEVGDSHRRLVDYLESLPAREVALGKVRRATGRSVSVATLLRAEARDEEKHAGQVRAYFSGF